MTEPPLFDVLGAGTLTVDDFLYVEHLPAADHKARIQRKARCLGGQVGTALAAAAALEASCGYAGILGADELSCAMREGLLAARIDLRFVQHGEATPMHSVIVVEEAAKTRTIFYDLAGAKPLAPESVTEQLVRAGRVLLLDQFSAGAGVALASRARELGTRVVLDLEWPDAPLIPELLDHASDVLLSLHFGSALTGLRDPERIVAVLHNERRQCTVVTCGTEGCFGQFGALGEILHTASFSVDTVETTGCGDVFHGAYAAFLARDPSREGSLGALRYASAAAAIYASRPTGWRYLPRPMEIEQLLVLENSAGLRLEAVFDPGNGL